MDFYAQHVVESIDRFDREIRECLQCGLQYIFPMYNDDDLRALYDCEGYHHFRNAIKGITQTQEKNWPQQPDYTAYFCLRAVQLGFDRFLAAHAHKNPGRKPKLLDIGTGDGHELHAFSTIGFDIHGIDLSDPLIAQVKKDYNIDVEKIAMEDLDESKKYDVITAFHIIEHLKNPHVLFTKAKNLLNPDGLFLIETPFLEDGGKTEQRFRDIYHTMFFDHFSLALLAAKNGFIPVRMTHRHYYAGDYYHSCMTMLFQYNEAFEKMFASFDKVAIVWMKSILSTLIEDARTWGRDALRHQHHL